MNGLSPLRRQAITWTQCWLIVNWKLRNKLPWNLDQHTKLFDLQNASENVVCGILSREEGWVKTYGDTALIKPEPVIRALLLSRTQYTMHKVLTLICIFLLSISRAIHWHQQWHICILPHISRNERIQIFLYFVATWHLLLTWFYWDQEIYDNYIYHMWDVITQHQQWSSEKRRQV